MPLNKIGDRPIIPLQSSNCLVESRAQNKHLEGPGATACTENHTSGLDILQPRRCFWARPLSRARRPSTLRPATRWTRAAMWCPTSAPPPPSSTTRRPAKCSGRRTRQGAAIDRQHHEGDDGDGVLRGQPGPDAGRDGSLAATSIRRRPRTSARGDKLTADDLLHLLLIASDNAAARGARARVAARRRRLRRPHERESRSELGLDEHALRGSVGPAVRQRLVGVRHGAADHAWRPNDDRDRLASCARPSTPSAPPTTGAHDLPQHEPPARTRRRRRPRRARPGSSRRPAIAWRRCCGCPEGGQEVAVVVLGARSNAGRFLETQNLLQLAVGQGLDAVRHQDDGRAAPQQQ